MSVAEAREFILRRFGPGDTIALLLRQNVEPHIRQRIVTREQATAQRYLAWLAKQNANGAHVYIAANPLRPGSRTRTKESVAEIRHLYLDIDQDGSTQIASLLAATEIPQPTCIASTSPGKYQVLWKVQGFSSERQEAMLKSLAFVFGGDPACTDSNRMIRLPGFLNHKYAPAHPVTAEYLNAAISSPDDFQLPKAVATAAPHRAITGHNTPRKRTQSEDDWSWVLAELRAGVGWEILTTELASRRSDKSNPAYYAERTVDLASARFALLNNLSLDGVVDMLVDRRRGELPATLASVRAREIADTAARMIARRSFYSRLGSASSS